jgi:hypothetical protein
VTSDSERFVNETLEVWRPYADGPLTPGDAREIIKNIDGFFGILARWDSVAGSESTLRTADSVEGQALEDEQRVYAAPDPVGPEET